LVKDFLLSNIISPLGSLDDLSDFSYIFIFCNNQILCKDESIDLNTPIFVWNPKDIKEFLILIDEKLKSANESWRAFQFAQYKEKQCLLINLNKKIYPDISEIEKNIHFFRDLRYFFRKNADQWLMLAGLSYQVYKWDNDHYFCGRCGNEFNYSSNEFAKQCTKCKNVLYPQLAPAIIIGILKENKILMAHNKRFPYRFFSVLAGFVNIGESLEETIEREIFEEVGIKIKNIKYIGSQPWPFPNSLMMGFIAEWQAGEIMCDGEEIDEASWFTSEELKKIMLPSQISIARKIIDKFLETN
jgi:NADH pyrophosphatase NudC (nudix superfamily)